MRDNYIVGLDLGSVSVNAVVINDEGKIVYEEKYARHNGQPLKMAREIVRKIAKNFSFRYLAVTGSNGEHLSKEWDIPYLEEVIAQAKGIYHLYPEVRTVIDIGGCDAKFIALDEKGDVSNFSMNEGCASGTGSFLDQQAKRLELNIEGEFARESLRSTNPARLAGRCAVFAKTDMIHLQQKATPMRDIAMGLCESLARGYKSSVARGKEFSEVISFQGGVAANRAMQVAFKKILKKDIIVPKHFHSIGALGVALFLRENKGAEKFNLSNLDKDFSSEQKKENLSKLSLEYEKEKPSREEKDYKFPSDGKVIDAYLGADIGSVSTNVVVIDSKKRVIAKSYLPTAGKPIKVVQDGLREIGEKIEGKVKIKGAGTTGSGRYMIGAFIGSDVIKNEITAQAKGALNIDFSVDTIFEIGGQDSKFISLKNGVIVDFTMNKVCAAGTGSFLEEQAETLKINIKKEFEEIAFSSDNPADLGDRCTVFMESSLVEHLQRGFHIPDLVAGLAYSIAYNYLNKVVENRKVGHNIFFQGGTACNRSVVAAFEKVLGRKITVPLHNEVLGAIGAAIVAMEETAGESKFKGFALSKVEYQMRSFECDGCPNHCLVNQVWIKGEEKPLTYGDRCGKHSEKEKIKGVKRIPDLFKRRERLWLGKKNKREKVKGETMGIPRILFNFELLPLWQSFFSELGYEVVLSDETNDDIIHKGVEAVTAEICFPIKVAHGHVLNLLERKVDYLFLPSLVDFEKESEGLKRSYDCPWSQALPYFINSSIYRESYSTKILESKLSLREEGLEKSLKKIGDELKENPLKVKKAIKIAREAQSQFYSDLKKKGREILEKLDGQRGFVVVSRPYNGYDSGLNLELAKKMRELGMLPIPVDFLDLDPSIISDDYPNMYWNYGQKILAAARKIKETDNLYPIYLTNFACGPDSFISKYFNEEMDRPYLELQIDEHSAEAGVITRLEAFLDSVKNRGVLEKRSSKAKSLLSRASLPDEKRTMYIPYMGDHSYAFEAALEALGRKAKVMKISDPETLREGQKYTTGRECYPCVLTTGDMIKTIKNNGFSPDQCAFFMGIAQGPCRFGQYCAFQELVLRRAGYKNIPILSLDSENSYGGLGVKFTKLAWEGIAAIDILCKVQRLIRPDEVNKGQTNKVYLKYRDKVRQRIKEGKGVIDIMEEAARSFKKIEREKTDRSAVTVVGEIFVRHNPFANEFIMDELEKHGLRMELASMREWFMYTNEMHKEVSLKERKWWEFIKNRTRNLWQEMIEKKLASPFKEIIKGYEEPEIQEIIEMGEEYLHRSLRGEAILTIGKTLHSIHRKRDGVVNVMPFTCMPGNITVAVMTQIEKDHPGFPILNLTYDGSHQANYLNKVRTFVYRVQAYHRKNN